MNEHKSKLLRLPSNEYVIYIHDKKTKITEIIYKKAKPIEGYINESI